MEDVLLSKKLTLAGAKVLVQEPKTGLPASYGGSEPVDHVSLFLDAKQTGPFFKVITARKGEELTILAPPKKVGRINLVHVRKDDGAMGYAYWCELRASANHIK